MEAKRLEDYHCELLKSLRPERMFFAYDTPDDRNPFIEAIERLDKFGVSKSTRYCYALCGYPNDTFESAEKRFREIWQYGAMPYAMLYRDRYGETNSQWRKFQRLFARPAIARSILNGKTQIKNS